MDNAQNYYKKAMACIKSRHPEFFTSGLVFDTTLYYDFSLFATFVIDEYIRKGNRAQMKRAAGTIDLLLQMNEKQVINTACVLNIIHHIGGVGQGLGYNIQLFFSYASPAVKSAVRSYYKKAALIKLGLHPDPVLYIPPALIFLVCLVSIILTYTIGSPGVDHWLYGGDAIVLFWIGLPLGTLWFYLVRRNRSL